MGKIEDFAYILDILNDPNNQKELGAFYTPIEYAKLGIELVREAIQEIRSENKNYIIIDRCAGSGNLEEYLTDEELKNTIVSTYEWKEWIVLNDKIGSKVKCIIPPYPIDPEKSKGLLQGGDALAQEIFEECKQYINDPNTRIILFENPPYADLTSGQNKKRTKKNNSIIKINMQNEKKYGTAVNDLANLFIWSGFKYYLKEKSYYVLYSPIKYWKSLNLANETFIRGYLINRKQFHSSESAISLILWRKENKEVIDEKIFLKPININKKNEKQEVERKDIPSYLLNNNSDNTIKIRRVHSLFSNIFYEKEIYEKIPIGYYRASSFNLNYSSVHLQNYKSDHSKALYYENYEQKLPLVCAKLFPTRNWYEKDVLFTSADLGNKYLEDREFIKKCFIYAISSDKNHSISKDDLINELCFRQETLSDKKLKIFNLDSEDLEILDSFERILKLIKEKKYKEFNSSYRYNLFQIQKEINTSYIDKDTNKKVYQHTELNTLIRNFKKLLFKYYQENILHKLINYELVK